MDKLHFKRAIALAIKPVGFMCVFLLLSVQCSYAQLSGTYTVGSGGNYTTLTAAVNALNTSGVSGAVTLSLTSADYSSAETFPITINQISGASATNRITIKPASGVNATINGATTSTGEALIKLNGADFITIDGSNTVSGTSRNLTITNTSALSTTAVIWISSLGTTTSARQNVIKNTNIIAGSNTVTSSFGIISSGTTISTTGTGANNDTLTIQNNTVKRAYYGIFVRGTTTARLDKLLITGNEIGSTTPSEYVTLKGIDIASALNPEISNNTIFNIKATASSTTIGIDIGTTSSGAVVTGNHISGIHSYFATGDGAYGINISSNVTNNGMIFANNMISDILASNNSSTSTSLNAFGIRFVGGSSHKIYYNSIHLFGISPLGSTGALTSALIVTSTTVTGYDIRNNIFANAMTGLSGAKAYAIYLAASGNISTIDYNNYWVPSSVGITGYIGSDKAALSDWVSATSQDAYSVSANPRFYSNTNLHSSSSSLNAAGTAISGYTTDYDGDTRNSSTPDIGADEYSPLSSDAGIAAILTPTQFGFCSSTDLKLRISNTGSSTLDTVELAVYINGSLYSNYKFNVAVAVDKDTELVVTNLSPSGQQNLRVDITKVNGVSDLNASNNTVSRSYKLISGTYTIGSTGDFLSFTSAVDTLHRYGVCGPVVFNVLNGTYTEQIEIQEIAGASATNTITFQSQSGDSSKVILDHPSQTVSANNYAVRLNGADYITFKNMTISRSGTNIYGFVVYIENGANNNTFTNNQIISALNTNANSECITSEDYTDNNNVFTNNLIKYGNYGIYYSGVSTTVLESGTRIENNIFDSAYQYGMAVYYQDASVVKNNIVRNLRNTTQYGIYLINNDNNITVTGNMVNLTNTTTYGIYLSSCDGTSSQPGLVANNMVSVGGSGTAYGFYINSTTYQNIVYNSALVHVSTTTSGRGVYSTGGANNNYYNNIFANTSGGYAAYFATAANVVASDYNNFYVPSSSANFIYYGSAQADLATYRTTSSLDGNSVSVDPRFKSVTNLHTSAIALNGKATPITGITTDFDGETRNTTTPDIGADEFTPPPVDAALNRLVSPAPGTCASPADLKVRLRNAGTDKIDSVYITYLLDGVFQSKTKFSVSLLTAKDTDLVVGTISLSTTPKTVKLFVSDANGNFGDGNDQNDTLVINVRTALSGTYSIGTSGDYASFNAAVSAIQSYGVCGPVVFNVADGTYNEQVSISEIGGASSTNTITFQSASGDSSKVVLTHPSSAIVQDNYTVSLSGADYITFKEMTITRSGTATYGRVIEVGGGADNNKFLNNRIIGLKLSSSSSNNVAVIFSTTDKDINNEFSSNLTKYGSFAFYWLGLSTDIETGNKINNNITDSAVYDTYRFGYQDDFHITNNQILNCGGGSGTWIVYLTNINTAYITGNKIITDAVCTYGLYMSASSAPSGSRGLIANNFISIGAASTASMYLPSAQNFDIVHNTLLQRSTSTSSKALYLSGSTTYNPGNNNFYNNIMVNTGAGLAMETVAAAVTYSTVSNSNYNNFYAPNATNPIIWGGTSYGSLAAYQSSVSQDANSIYTDPKLASSTDYHTFNRLLNGAATPLTYVTTDIDGDTRNSTTPDIGADEFDPRNKDLEAVEIINPANGSCGDSSMAVQVVIFNNGAQSQTGFNIGAVVTGAVNTSLSYTYNSTLDPGEFDTVLFSNTLNTFAGGSLNITAYTQLSGEEFKADDTAKVSVTINATPVRPSVTPDATCGEGTVTLKASGVSGQTINWYDDISAGIPVATGGAFTTPILSASKTYYASVRTQFNNSITTTFAGGTATFKGNFFDLTPKVNITIDSFDIHTSATGSIDVEVYYKKGTYVSYENTSSAWTQLGSTATVTGSGANNATTVNTGASLELEANTVYGIYVVITSGGNITYTTGANTYSNTDLSMTLGAGINGTFTGSPATPRTWNGTIYYNVSGCESPRAPVVATVNSGLGGAENIKGSPFEGTYAAGTEKDPDLVCAESTLAYEVTPPTSYSNADFGTKWVISSLTFETATGTPAKDTTLTIPTASSNGKLTFTPISSLGDSMLIITATFVDMVTGCDSISTRYIKVLPLPKPAFAATSVCLGESVSITNQSTGGTSYLYRLGDGNTSTNANLTHTYSMAGKYDITQIVTNASGCMDSTVVTVNVFDLPIAAFNFPTNDSNYVCTGAQVAFTDASTTTNTLSHLWNFGDGNTSIDANPTHTYTAEGTYDVKLVVTNANGCKDSITQTINVEMQPVADFTASDMCDGEVVTFTDNSTIGSGQVIRFYDFGDGNSSTDANTTHTYAQAGAYTVSYAVIGMGGCYDSVSKQLTIFDRAKVGFNHIADCDLTVNFDDTSKLNNSTIIDRTWYFGDGADLTTSQTPVASHTYAIAGNYDVKLVVTTVNGCRDSATIQVTVLDRPEVQFTANKADFCLGETTSFTNQSTGTNLSHAWSFGDGITSADESPSHTYTAVGNYTVWMVTTNAAGCKDSASLNITVNDVPTADFIATTACIGEATNFAGSPAGAASYEWNFGDGNTADVQSPAHTYAAAGTYTVTLKVKNGVGCEDSFISSVVVNPLPDAGFTFNANFLEVAFTADDLNNATYEWSFGDDSTSSAVNPTHTYAVEGTYTVKLITTNANGCLDSTSQLVTVQANGITDIKAAPLSVNVYPNPFSSTTKVEFNLDRPQVVTITINDLTGKELGVVAKGMQAEGNHNFIINAESYNMSAGTYLIKVQAGDKHTVKRLILTK